MDIKIVEGQVVQTTIIDLTEYFNKKKQELEMLTQQIASLQKMQVDVLAELQALIPVEVINEVTE